MREIRFINLEDAVQEILRLEKVSKKTSGIWSYYQILNHCAEILEQSMDGYPIMAPWVIRKTIGQIIKHKTFFQGYMDRGAFNPTAPKNREEGDEKKAQERLLNAINKLQKFNGKLKPHPFFDELSRTDYEKLHSFHIANHLCFVEDI